MSKAEADKVIKWCYDNALRRPVVTNDRHRYVLRWEMATGGDFVTNQYDSARHWCRIMEIEHKAGVIGYWQARAAETSPKGQLPGKPKRQ